MKKSQLKNIIREEIKQLTEQDNFGCYDALTACGDDCMNNTLVPNTAPCLAICQAAYQACTSQPGYVPFPDWPWPVPGGDTTGIGGGTSTGGGSGGGGVSCFSAGTAIQLAEGTLPIEQIKVNDIVKTFNTKTKEVETSKVNEIMVHKDITDGLLLNGLIKTTTNHFFYSSGKWIEAGNLSIGDKILHVNGLEHTIESMEIDKTPRTVYNFEVDNTHNYFAEGYLVHNAKIQYPGGIDPDPASVRSISKNTMGKIIRESIKQLMTEQNKENKCEARVIPADKMESAVHKFKPCEPITPGNWSTPSAYTSATACGATITTWWPGFPGSNLCTSWPVANNLFYAHVGSPQIGEVVKIHHSACFGEAEYCLEYLGQGQGSSWSQLHFTSLTSTHDDCKECLNGGGGEYEGCLDPNATNNGACCDPNISPGDCTIHNKKCCKYERGGCPTGNIITPNDPDWGACQECLQIQPSAMTGPPAAITGPHCECCREEVSEEIECHKCLNGYPIGNMFPNPPGCDNTQGWYTVQTFNSDDCFPTGDNGEHPEDMPPIDKGLREILQRRANIK